MLSLKFFVIEPLLLVQERRYYSLVNLALCVLKKLGHMDDVCINMLCTYGVTTNYFGNWKNFMSNSNDYRLQ